MLSSFVWEVLHQNKVTWHLAKIPQVCSRVWTQVQWRGQAQETKLLLCIDIQHTHGQKDEALGCVWVIAMATGYIFSLFLSLSALAQVFFPRFTLVYQCVAVCYMNCHWNKEVSHWWWVKSLILFFPAQLPDLIAAALHFACRCILSQINIQVKCQSTVL